MGMIESYIMLAEWVSHKNWFIWFIIFFCLWLLGFITSIVMLIVFRSEIWFQVQKKILKRKFIKLFVQNPYGDMISKYVSRNCYSDGKLTLEENGEKETYLIDHEEDIYYIDKYWTIFLGHEAVAASHILLKHRKDEKDFALNLVHIKNLRVAKFIQSLPLFSDWTEARLKFTAKELQRHLDAHIVRDTLEATEERKNNNSTLIYVLIAIGILVLLGLVIYFSKGMK